MMLIMARIEIPAKEKCFFFFLCLYEHTHFIYESDNKKNCQIKKLFMHQYQRIFCFF